MWGVSLILLYIKQQKGENETTATELKIFTVITAQEKAKCTQNGKKKSKKINESNQPNYRCTYSS